MTTAVRPRGAEAPAVLLPYQRRWVLDRASVKIANKGRRVGLSWADAYESAETAAAARSAGGMDVFYISYDKEMTRQYINDCAFWARHMALAASQIDEYVYVDSYRDGDEEKSQEIQAFRITFASGFHIVALSSRPRGLRSKQGRVVLDEAAFVDDPEAVIEAALAMLIWGGRVAIISTHNGVENPFNELLMDVAAGRRNYSVHTITFRDAIGDGLYRRICETRGKPWSQEAEDAWAEEIFAKYKSAEDADQELMCIPKRSIGQYIARALIEARMTPETPVVRLSVPDTFARESDYDRTEFVRRWLEAEVAPLLRRLDPERSTYIGQDFGRFVDLTVLAVGQDRQDLVRQVRLLVELQNVPFKQQEEVWYYIAERVPRFRAAGVDKGGNGAQLAEAVAQRYGYERVFGIQLSQAWYAEWLPKFKAALEDGTLDDLPQDADTLDDIRLIKLDKGIPRIPDAKRNSTRGGKRHGDAAIALALLWFASSQDVDEYGYVAVPRHEPPADGRRRYSDRPRRDDDVATGSLLGRQRGAY